MITRIWHGWTTPEQADAYESLLRREVFPGIPAKKINGLARIDLLRRRDDPMVEFVTLLWFRDLDAVRELAGADWRAAYVPDAARALLSRFDERAVHYEQRESV